jgi:hypothetical protein
LNNEPLVPSRWEPYEAISYVRNCVGACLPRPRATSPSNFMLQLAKEDIPEVVAKCDHLSELSFLPLPVLPGKQFRIPPAGRYPSRELFRARS